MKIETPWKDNGLSNYKKKQKIEGYFRKIMLTLGMDLEDDSLKDTPKRVAKMYVDEVFSGLMPENFPKITVVENKMLYIQPLVEVNITLNSNCEHHFVPIIGVAHVAYIPRHKVIGLSKLNRIVQYYGARPQIQERLNLQIVTKLKELLETDDVAVVIDAVHTCVRSRGIKDSSSLTRTMSLSGKFLDTEGWGKEFLATIPKAAEFKL